MQALLKDKKMLGIVIAGVCLVVLVAVVFFMRGKSATTKSPTALSPTAEAIPTVDASVHVNLAYSVPGKEAKLTVEAVPADTTSMDYELSYQTAKQGLQGVIGTIASDSQKTSYEKKLTLGTCSSGTCVYHEVVGKIQVTIRFNGSYGEKLFQKDFSL